jgi:hypothetical protein
MLDPSSLDLYARPGPKHLYGIARPDDKLAIPCATVVPGPKRPSFLCFYFPWGALEDVFGADIVYGDDAWTRQLEDWFADVAAGVYRHAPFAGAAIGEEMSAAMLVGDNWQANKRVPRIVPDGSGGVRYLPARRE